MVNTLKIPHATAEGIWNKAAMLIREENTSCGSRMWAKR